MASKKDYEELLSLYKDAQSKIKRVSRVSGELVIPAINQLRYAGEHILNSIVSESGDSRDKELLKAGLHCKRAIYDTTEGGIIFLLEQIKLFKEDYKYIPISAVIPDYIKKLQIVDKIKNRLKVISKHNTDSILEYYEEMQKYFEELDPILEYFNLARDELSKKLNLWRLGLILSFSALFIAFLTLIIMIILK